MQTVPPVADAVPAEGGVSARLVPALLDAALQAWRGGTFDELVREHPRAARWLLRRHGALIRGTAGDALGPEPLAAQARLLLGWLVVRLRPDARPDFEGLGEPEWLHLAGWRPVVAMAAQLGLVTVPDFPRRYRRHAGEGPLDNLCGLWSVGPSTVYRLLDRARQGMVQTLLARVDALQAMTLRHWVTRRAEALLGLHDDAARIAWHRRQMVAAEAAHDAAALLWHARLAGDVDACLDVLRRHTAALAEAPETDALLDRLSAGEASPRGRMELWLARAALARTRQQVERELPALEQARDVAQAARDPLLLGIVHSALGKYHEPRDAGRAFACYQESAEFLRAHGTEAIDERAVEHFVTTHARLAWLYVLRNDPRARAVLDSAEALRVRQPVPDAVLGMLEQVWGEYWHRAGDAARSLEHRYRALAIFERVGDRRSVLASYLNIGLDLATRGDHDRAIDYLERILEAARRGEVEPAIVVGAHLNLGASLFWRGDLARAIDEYRAGLAASQAAGLRLHAFRARYNLAEAHYTRFRDQGDAADEAAADGHVRDALAAGSDASPAALDALRQLKGELLGRAAEPQPNRLLPAEDAAHFDEMAEVRRQRALLAVPAEAARHAEAHLAIARAYAAIAAKEREAARAIVEREGLHERFASEFAEVRQTFERELSLEDRVAARWKQAAPELLDDARRAAVVAHLLREGALGKSVYGELAAVSPATASKHLATLAERGLVVQKGKGPSTRYERAD